MIHARPTTYNGIQMRSRLEAAFAATLDDTSCTWQYEPRCFASPQGQYLPDFLIDDKSYVEIKPPVADFDAALDRMHIILASEPDAHLTVVSGTQGKPWVTERTCTPCQASECRCSRQRGPCDTTCGCTYNTCDRCGKAATHEVRINPTDQQVSRDPTTQLCWDCADDYHDCFISGGHSYRGESIESTQQALAAARHQLSQRDCDSCGSPATHIHHIKDIPGYDGILYFCETHKQPIPREGAAAAARRQLAERTR